MLIGNDPKLDPIQELRDALAELSMPVGNMDPNGRQKLLERHLRWQRATFPGAVKALLDAYDAALARGASRAADIVQAEITRAEALLNVEEGGAPVFDRAQTEAGICALRTVLAALQHEATAGVTGHQNSCSKSSSTSTDTDDAPLIEHQLSGLLEGIGASEDHEDSIAFFVKNGISVEAAKRLVAALALHRFVPVDVLRTYGVALPLEGRKP